MSVAQMPSHNAPRQTNRRLPRDWVGREEASMSDKVYEVPAEWRKRAYMDEAKYKEWHARSIKDPNGFWAEQAKRIDWIKPFSKVKNTSYDPHNV